jgi:hypothetical protein
VCRRTLLYCPSWLLWLSLLKHLLLVNQMHAMPAHTPASNPHTPAHTPRHSISPALSQHPHYTPTACCRELVAADHDAVVVLQLRSGMRWGAPSEFYTGHNANGRRVTLDASDPTRHIIAGLAKSLAGVGGGGAGVLGRGLGAGRWGAVAGGLWQGKKRCFEGHRGASQTLASEGVFLEGGGEGGGQFPGWNRVGQQELGGTAAGNKQQLEGGAKKGLVWCSFRVLTDGDGPLQSNVEHIIQLSTPPYHPPSLPPFLPPSSGVVPPQTRYSASTKSLHHDWRWATGATPFGPYSNYSAVRGGGGGAGGGEGWCLGGGG